MWERVNGRFPVVRVVGSVGRNGNGRFHSPKIPTQVSFQDPLRNPILIGKRNGNSSRRLVRMTYFSRKPVH